MTEARENIEMDDFAFNHLCDWIDSKFVDEERFTNLQLIMDFLCEHRELLNENRSWGEILHLACRSL